MAAAAFTLANHTVAGGSWVKWPHSSSVSPQKVFESTWMSKSSLLAANANDSHPRCLLLFRRGPWSSSLATAWKNCCRASKTCTNFTSTPLSTPSSPSGRSTKTRSELKDLVELNWWPVSPSWRINPLVCLVSRYQEVSLIEAPAQLSLNWLLLLVLVELYCLFFFLFFLCTTILNTACSSWSRAEPLDFLKYFYMRQMSVVGKSSNFKSDLARWHLWSHSGNQRLWLAVSRNRL